MAINSGNLVVIDAIDQTVTSKGKAQDEGIEETRNIASQIKAFMDAGAFAEPVNFDVVISAKPKLKKEAVDIITAAKGAIMAECDYMNGNAKGKCIHILFHGSAEKSVISTQVFAALAIGGRDHGLSILGRLPEVKDEIAKLAQLV